MRHSSPERRRLRITGVVQGVGFRPFVHGLARRRGLAGFVLNDGRGIVIEAEGPPPELDSFGAGLRANAPPLARVDSLTVERLAPRGEAEFRIAPSEGGAGGAAIPADVATCDECLRELRDPSDRRHRYPFINCTQCGPRFTIVERVPYDRPNTTMARFEMCGACRKEYENPSDRRFHAEPIACPACGPRLELSHGEGSRTRGDAALWGADEALRDGAILAVKGLGGYHLACDAGNEQSVARLRSRKHREEKPFALMAADPGALCEVSDIEADRLRSRDRPIVLLRRRPDAPVAAAVAPRSPWLGVMLPYTALHHLLLAEFGGPLVMTSGNRSDEPIAFEDADARARLGGIAEAFLSHDRPIHRRCEDSVVRAAFPVRRSRGRVPGAVPLPVEARRTIVAAGAELKATFCVARGYDAFLSAHLGDLDSELAYRSFRADLELYVKMLDVRPDVVACDMHPDYLSTRWAHERAAEPLEVQHHHAHAAACLAEHGERGQALALVFDGTGYGTDGTLWGGELLRCDLGSFERLAHLEPVPLPGGERAIHEPWRTAAAYLERAGRPVPSRPPFERWPAARESLKVNAPPSSGMGRLFDAVAALLGIRDRVSYEGQAAIELEWAAGGTPARPYPCRLADGLIVGSDLVAAAHDDLADGRPRAQIAAAFHEGVAAVAAAACAASRGPRTVALSGGTFQNLRLARSVRTRLEAEGFRVLAHRRVPPNDGGISYGQAAVAAARIGDRGGE